MHEDKFQNKYRIPSARLAYWDYGADGWYFVTICTHERLHYFGTVVETQNIASQTPQAEIPSQTQNIASQTPQVEIPSQTQNIASQTPQAEIPSQTQNIASQSPQTEIPSQTQNIASLQATEIGKVANDNWLQIPQHFPFVELDEFVVMPNHVHGILVINKTDPAATQVETQNISSQLPQTQNIAPLQEWKPNTFGPQSKNLASVIRGYKASVKTHATINQIDFKWQARYYDRVIRDEKELQNIRLYILNNLSKWNDDMHNPENLFM